jgi:hypothetical protein
MKNSAARINPNSNIRVAIYTAGSGGVTQLMYERVAPPILTKIPKIAASRTDIAQGTVPPEPKKTAIQPRAQNAIAKVVRKDAERPEALKAVAVKLMPRIRR